MKLFCYRALTLVGALVWAFGVARAAEAPESANTVEEALSGGKLLLHVRPRIELVDQDGKSDKAQAFTVRTLLGWETKPYYGFSVAAQAIDVTRVGEKDYNDDAAQAASSRFPLVAIHVILIPINYF